MLGLREASINKAEGEKKSKILVSEANQLEQINRARGEADALTKMAQAKADSIRLVAKALAEGVRRTFMRVRVSHFVSLVFSSLKMIRYIY